KALGQLLRSLTAGIGCEEGSKRNSVRIYLHSIEATADFPYPAPMPQSIHIIGGGLAGSEAAWQVAGAGLHVVLHEMRPERMTEAHKTDGLAELVCSNSFRSDDAANSAVGLLHAEMRRLG